MDTPENQPTSNCHHCGSVLTKETTGGLCPRCLLEMNLASRTMPDGETTPQSPPQSPPLTPEEIAEYFPQFEILEYLGRGGMGIVYKARQKVLDRLVAIKVLAGERRDDPQFEARFSREARILAKLSHPNIVTVHDFGENNGMFYLVMEYVDGVNLRDVLRDERMEPAQALAIVPSICEALQFAHDHGVVHRDIKPENILMDRDGRVKIADFGIATLVGSAAERSGTPPYMAPEQEAADGTVDHRADIYALGVVFYEMLTGERPEQDPSKPSRRVEIDVRLDEIVLRALEKEPEQRYQTAGEFRTVVETVAAAPHTEADIPSREQGSSDKRVKVFAFGHTLMSGLNLLASKYGRLGLIFMAFGGLIALGAIANFNFMFGVEKSAMLLMGVILVGFGALAAVLEGRTKQSSSGTLNVRATEGSCAKSTGNPRFSRLAIWGAVWAPFILIFVFKFFVEGGPAEQRTGPEWWQILLMVTLLPLGLTAPFGTTILGWISVAQIRRSAGKLYGLGLAVFDGMLFPLLALDALIGGLWLLFFQAFARWTGDDILPNTAILLLLTLVTAIIVDFIIVRAVWRAVKRPLEGSDPTPPKAPESQTVISPGRSPGPAKKRKWARSALVSVVALAAVITALLFWVQRPQRIDDRNISADSPDGMYSAMGQTWHAMRVFGSDRVFYRFIVRGRAGAVFEKWEVEVPSDKLATSYDLQANDDILFGKRGSIVWSEDGKRASFQINEVEVAGFDAAARKPTDPGKAQNTPEQAARQYFEALFSGDAERVLSSLGSPLIESREEIATAIWRLQVQGKTAEQAPELVEWHQEGPYAVTSWEYPPMKEGLDRKPYLVLERFVGTWRIAWGNDIRADASLSEILRCFKQFRLVSREDPKEVAREFIAAFGKGDADAAKMLTAPPLSYQMDKLARELVKANQGQGASGHKPASPRGWHQDGPYAVTRARLLPDKPEIEIYFVLKRTGKIWRVVGANGSRPKASLAENLKHYKQERMVGRMTVEDLALRFLVAIREKDEKTLRELSVDRTEGWTDTLVEQFSVELREWFRESSGGEFTLYPVNIQVDKDLGVVQCLAFKDVQKKLNGNCLVLYFCRTESGWKIWNAHKAPESKPMNEHLEQACKWAEEWKTAPNTSSRTVTKNTPEQTAREFMDAVLSGYVDKAGSHLGPPMRDHHSKLVREMANSKGIKLDNSSFEKWHIEEPFAVTRLTFTLPGKAKKYTKTMVLRHSRNTWQIVSITSTKAHDSLADELERFKQDPERKKHPQPPPAKIIVEEAALHLLVAIREKDEAKMRELCVDRTKGWTDALVGHFSMELRERFRQSTGEEFTLYPGKSLVDGDLAVVKCRASNKAQKKLNGNILVLYFCRTEAGWKNWTLRKTMDSQPLAEHLEQAQKWAAEWENAPSPSETSGNPLDAPAFGPVMERTMASRSKGGQGSYLNLETGRQMTPPKMRREASLNTELGTWARKSGLDGTIWLHKVNDIVADGAFQGFDVLAMSAPDHAWKQMTPVELKQQLDREIKARNLGLPCISKMKARDGSHRTIVWLIKTREGSYGMLQIVGFIDTPPGVKLRYKLVREDAPVADGDSLKKAKALLVTPPVTMPEGSPLTAEQVRQVLEGVTWNKFIATFADDGHEGEVAWKQAVSEGGNGMRFEVSFTFGGEKMRIDLEVDPKFQLATPTRLGPAKRPEQMEANPSEFLPQMAIRYAVKTNHPAVVPMVKDRIEQVKTLSTMREYAVAVAVYQADTDSLPPDLQSLVGKQYLPALRLMMNHETGKMEVPLYHGGLGLRAVDFDNWKTILFASPSADKAGKRVVGFLDSSVKVIDESEYQKQLKAQRKPPLERTVDAFLESCATGGVNTGKKMLEALRMAKFIAKYGSGEKAHRDHHDKLPPVMRFAIAKSTGEPSPAFVKYLRSISEEEDSKHKAQALLLLRMLGISPRDGND